jgi:cytochrome c-type biogenesis protein CcmE
VRAGLRWGVLGLLVAGCVGYLVLTATQTSAVTYVTVAELKARPPTGEARVLGTVRDDVIRSPDGLQIAFTAVDGSDAMPVEYRGQVPDIFKPGIQVVVEGRWGGDGVFHARTLLAKCPSRFTAASPAASR